MCLSRTTNLRWRAYRICDRGESKVSDPGHGIAYVDKRTPYRGVCT
jgi:hypothetical protein